VAGLTVYDTQQTPVLEVQLVGKPPQYVLASQIHSELLIQGGLLNQGKWKLSYYMRTHTLTALRELVAELHHTATTLEDTSDLSVMSSAVVDLTGDKLELVLRDIIDVRLVLSCLLLGFFHKNRRLRGQEAKQHTQLIRQRGTHAAVPSERERYQQSGRAHHLHGMPLWLLLTMSSVRRCVLQPPDEIITLALRLRSFWAWSICRSTWTRRWRRCIQSWMWALQLT
jgi:hypothetical protein